MSNKCYKPLRKYIHIVANTTIANPENKNDKLQNTPHFGGDQRYSHKN